MASSPLKIAQDVLSPAMAKKLWTGNYDKALPFTVMDFELSAVLPAIFYMFRFGQRRGKGRFIDTIVPEGGSPSERRRRATIDRVASVLAGQECVAGFDCGARLAILGDLFLCFGLDNVNHELGRERAVQRAFPTHYMTCWIDLPDHVAHLRGVPEMLVAMLSNQNKGPHIVDVDKGWFRIGAHYDENQLIAAFSKGMYCDGPPGDRSSDQFNEEDEDVGLDQLLMIRLAQTLGAAPDKAFGKAAQRIPNQHPIARLAARHFSEDIRRFLRSYTGQIPRQTLIDMLEACISVGMITMFTSTVRILFDWSASGDVPQDSDQLPAALFVDCSNGVDNDLRLLSEQSLDDLLRQVERVPAMLAMLRLLDHLAEGDSKIKKLNIDARPDATEWINLLGALLHERHAQANFMHQLVGLHCSKLADGLLADRPELASLFLEDADEPNAVRRFAAGLAGMMGNRARQHLIGAVDSILQANRPNGLSQKRTTTRGSGSGSTGRRSREVRSLVFSDATLEYLVHVRLLPDGNKRGLQRLSMRDFLAVLRERYGFYVDRAPSGLSVSSELLQRNRQVLDRRLRDLGLLLGVNDAESMKRLRPRFERNGEV